MNPVTILDRLTDSLGAFLLRLGEQCIALLGRATSLPTGYQVLLGLGLAGGMGLCFLWMRSAFGDAAAIAKGVRKAGRDYADAKQALAIRDRRKAWGYLMGVAFLLAVGALVLFLVLAMRSPSSPPPVSDFSGR